MSQILAILNERNYIIYFCRKMLNTFNISSLSPSFFSLFFFSPLSTMLIALETLSAWESNGRDTEHANYLHRGHKVSERQVLIRWNNCNIHSFLFFLFSVFFPKCSQVCVHISSESCLHFNKDFLVGFCGVKQMAVLLPSPQNRIH